MKQILPRDVGVVPRQEVKSWKNPKTESSLKVGVAKARGVGVVTTESIS